VATWLTGLVGLDDRVQFECASALELPGDADRFDLATMVHVGMNIADKGQLCNEAARVLRPGGIFAIYDIMRNRDGEMAFPVPWAADAATSAVATPDEYIEHLETAGFDIVVVEGRMAATVAFFDQLAAAPARGPAPLGTHLVMGPETPTKVQNMITSVRAGLIAPVEILARLGDA
jgi:SAM-dependent methyltransferase